ncbi:MAG: response regulator [Rhodothermales bacterium]|nr:response regulator [Rhodothermales bacterium]
MTPPSTSAPTPPRSGRNPDGPPVRVLLVEDNPGDVLLAKEALEEAQMPVELHVVDDGEEAVAFLRKEGVHAEVPTPTLILLDLNLPKKSGLEVLCEVKEDDALRSIPVVIFSSSEAKEDIAQAYACHANCYVTKPGDLSDLVRVVKAIESFWLTVVRLPRRKVA